MEYQIARKGLGIKILIAPKVDVSNFLNFLNDYTTSIRFFREALQFIEKDLSLKNYHLCILPPPFNEGKHRPFYETVNDKMKAAMINCGFVISVTNDGESRNPPIDAPELFNLDLPIRLETEAVSVQSSVLSRDLLLEEDLENDMRSVLDASGRPCFVIVPRKFISSLNDCSDLQMYSIFILAKEALTKYTNGQYLKIIVNRGDYMNVSHLHMKVFVDSNMFERSFGHYEPLIKLRKSITYQRS